MTRQPFSIYNPARIISQRAEANSASPQPSIKENLWQLAHHFCPNWIRKWRALAKRSNASRKTNSIFAPHPKSFTMINLATHITNMLGWGRDTLASDSFDVAPVGGEPYKRRPGEASVAETCSKKFDKNLAEFREGLAKATDEEMFANWSLLAGGNVLFTMPRIACIRGHDSQSPDSSSRTASPFT